MDRQPTWLFTIVSVVVVSVLSSCIVWWVTKPEEPKISSVSQTSEYNSTTTYDGVKQILNLTNQSDARNGTLGSVIITAPGALIEIFDATTTNKNLRAASMTTATIRLGIIPAEAAVGTYTFDTFFRYGLQVVFGSTDIPTSTVTFR